MQTLKTMTPEEIRATVDKLIAPENANDEALALMNLLMTTTDPDNDEAYDAAMTAATHAFTKTSAFYAAFLEFAELPNFSTGTASVKKVIEGWNNVIQLDDQN